MAEEPKKAGDLDPADHYKPNLIVVLSDPDIPEGPAKESVRLDLGDIVQKQITVDDTLSPYTMSEGMDVHIDNETAEVTVRLPLPADCYGFKPINIFPMFNNYSTYKLTILRNGNNIGGVADDVEVTTNGLALRFKYIDPTYGFAVTAIS